ncbi:MAG: restriction endonuclease subunit S [Bacteroidales bacterium]|nr:restriction endonuclease subunit S [Bacteroidales bacterium]
MQTEVKIHLQFVPFSNLLNWSVQYMLETKFSYTEKYPLVEIGSFLKRNKTGVDIEDDKEYKRVTIKINNGGVFLRDIEKGKNIGTKKQFVVSEGQFLLSKIDARNGAFGVVSREVDGAVITGNFWTFDVDYSIINPHFLSLITTTSEFIKFSENASNGTTNRHYLQEHLFLAQKIPLPPLTEQTRIVENYNTKLKEAKVLEEQVRNLEVGIEKYLFDSLDIEVSYKPTNVGKLFFVNYVNIRKWGINKIFESSNQPSAKYGIYSFEKRLELFREIIRGKSPKYSNQSQNIILNQKCNRWNEIDLSHTKTVDHNWLRSLNENHFTQIGDILINSTGEGTIGRASTIMEGFTNLMYDSHILLLRVNTDFIYPDFFTLLFNSSYGQQQVNSIKSAQATKQTELGIGNLQKIKLPLPPLSVQNEIANHIQEKREQVKNLKQGAEMKRRNAITEFEKEILNI